MKKLFRRDPAPAERDYSFGDWLSWTQWSFQGNTYVDQVQTTMPGQRVEPIGNSFTDYIWRGLHGNGVIFGLESVRMRVFAQARFQYQRLRNGRPGDFFGTPDLGLLENPWPGGTTGDLLSAMLLHADFAGTAFATVINGQIVLLRPDWVQVVLQERSYSDGVQGGTVGFEKVGYQYYHGGIAQSKTPVVFAADEVAYFAPSPDPLSAWGRGMSWLTPIVREILSDTAMTQHKLRFMENSASPNLAVSLPKELTKDQFLEFVDAMDEKHKGYQNAGKTLYTGGGADITVIGHSLQQIDFKAVQGAGETRLAQAAGVPPVVAGLSEGLAGSSLNAGNFGQARRQFADITLAHLWQNVAGSLEVLFPAPGGSRLWVDSRDIPFLREDQKDAAAIQNQEAQTVRSLLDAGFEPDSVLAAVMNEDWSLLVGQHTGLYSVQLQTPGSTKMPTVPAPEEVAAGTSQMPGKDLSPQLGKAMPALPPAREDPVINVNVDARTFIDRGAITTNLDNSTHTSNAEEVISEFVGQLRLEGMFEPAQLPAPVVNVPAPIVNVDQRPRSVRKDVVRGDDGRIVHVIETELA